MNSAEIENSTLPNSGDPSSSGASEHVENVDYEAAIGEAYQAETLDRGAPAGAGAAAGAAATSGAVDSAATTLADAGHEKLSQAASALSEQIRKVSSYFENRGLEDVIGDARRLVQRNPALFIAGGVAVGFALSRLLTGVQQTRPGRRH